MLRRLLHKVFAPRAASAREGVVDHAQDMARRLAAAQQAFQRGRSMEASTACRALLARDPDHAPAHSLLAAITLPGEDYLHVLQRIHAHLRPRTYLEIGVASGESLRVLGPGTRAIGVDPAPVLAAPLSDQVRIVPETSDAFFARADVSTLWGGLPVELAFIDGMHLLEFALRDFINIEALCAPGATILIHDVYPLDERTAARERVTQFWSGDLWRLIVLLRRHRPDLLVRTIATAPTGLALVRNLDPGSTYLREHYAALINEHHALDFAFLAADKDEKLALCPNHWPAVRALLDVPCAASRATPPAQDPRECSPPDPPPEGRG